MLKSEMQFDYHPLTKVHEKAITGPYLIDIVI